jgi:hypothetical protein
MSTADAARWHMATPENPMVITALVVLEQRLPLEALEDLVRSKLLRIPRFHQRVVEGAAGPRWRAEEAFELAAHVRWLREPVAIGDGQLARIAGERMSLPLPRERSPWTIDLLDLASGESALLVRVHHGIADGQALVTVLGELADQAPDPTPPAATRPSGNAASRLWHSVGGLGRLVVDPDEPVTRLRGRVTGQKRVAWSGAVSVAAAKELARGRGHHLIDVLLAGVAGALGRYLRLHDAEPVDVRGLMPIAASPGGNRRMGNHFASVSVRLPLTEPDPHRRMARIAAEVIRLRSRSESLARALIGIAGSVAPGLERRAVRWRSRKVSLVVSSLRGPDQKVALAGVRVRTIVVWAPAPASVALSLALFGYADELRLGVASDAGVIADPHQIVGAFEEEMNALLPGAAVRAP